MNIVTIVGARPQFIKAAMVSRSFALKDQIVEKIIHTGQHFDRNMSDIFFTEMAIPLPHYNLDINGLTHGAMTGQMIEKIESILIKEQPQLVLVYGDTNSTLAGAIAAKKLHIKIAHIEAGLRSFNNDMPEEINRILTDRISDILFCPTEVAVRNLENEGFNKLKPKIILSGDIMLDAARFYTNKAKKPLFPVSKEFVLCTVHREDNTEDIKKLRNVMEAIDDIAKNINVIMPIHPRTKKKLDSINFNFDNSDICFVSPVGYLEMVYLLKNCELVMTDSGGLQKEAYFFSKNCVILRDETEWTELVDNDCNFLAGNNPKNIMNCFNKALMYNSTFKEGLYGDGTTAEIITNELLLN